MKKWFVQEDIVRKINNTSQTFLVKKVESKGTLLTLETSIDNNIRIGDRLVLYYTGEPKNIYCKTLKVLAVG